MRTLIFITLVLGVTLCSGSRSFTQGVDLTAEKAHDYLLATDTAIRGKPAKKKISVLILPPYDLIANEGISPDTQKYLEEELSKDISLAVIKFPYRKLMNVPYQNVFDKKYCKPVMNKIKADKIVMTRLDQVTGTGNMGTDKWNVRIRIYDTHTDEQKNSKLVIHELTSGEIRNILAVKHDVLTDEIKNNR